MRISLLVISLMIFSACSGLEQSEYKRVRKENELGEYIYREKDDRTFRLDVIQKSVTQKHPWEEKFIGEIPAISKEFFRCKGDSLNPSFKLGEEMVYDCNGKHSLPLHDEKEFVYPILIEILNYIQEKTSKVVHITSGHRCPDHNRYVDSSKFNRTSKHMIAAEVSFYVEGVEENPESIIKLIEEFYRSHGKKEYSTFKRYGKGDTNVKTQPWFNKEVFLKLYLPDEGRNFDNRHTYPYLSLQVRHDRDKQAHVYYGWNEAYKSYYRY